MFSPLMLLPQPMNDNKKAAMKALGPPVNQIKHAGGKCPMCDREMQPSYKNEERYKASRDHILPRKFGGRSWMYGQAPNNAACDDWKSWGVRNYRIMCQECNSLLNLCGQCVGALAAFRDVADATGKDIWDLLRENDTSAVAFFSRRPEDQLHDKAPE